MLQSYLSQLLFLTVLFSFLSLSSNGQEKTPTINIGAKVLDADDRSPLAYATVYNQSTGKGTVTNLEGYFQLRNVRRNDTISISFIGYQKKSLMAESLISKQVILLEKRSELINEVIISSDDSYLYNILSKCRKTQTYNRKTAKTYFSLETTATDRQVEMLECYYNGEYAGYNLNELQLKNGRIAVTNYENKFFISTEPSKVMCMYRVFDDNDLFPYNPLELRKRKLKKSYDLTLVSRFKNEHDKTIYVISFEPKEEKRIHFSGKVWVDSLDNSVVKLNLKNPDVAVHPFIPIWKSDSIHSVSMDISRTFQSIDGDMYISSMDFNYQLQYEHRDGSVENISTNAVLYAYDYHDRFSAPVFHFANPDINDYRRINATPYSDHFWKNFDEFKLNDLKHRNEAFVNDESTISNRTLFLENTISKKGLLEHTYIHWQGNRVIFRKQLPEEGDEEDIHKKIPASKYRLEVHIYLDVYHIGDSLHITTSTVFDPYLSFYDPVITPETNAFINMYFDLMEIERRELEKEVRSTCETESQVMEAYRKKQEEIKKVSKQFFADIRHGMRRRGMEKWNNVIVEELGIDNLSMFEVYETKKAQSE